MKEIKITIDEEGNVTLDVNGVQGNLCLTETKKLEQQLGIITKRNKKTSFYAKIIKKNNQKTTR